MALTIGCNHVALLTEDLDRFIDFYQTIFEAEVTAQLDEDGMRHALVDLGAGFWLHPFQLPAGASDDARASSSMFGRGHLDHLAINVSDEATLQELRDRLMAAGATDGVITDFGAVRTVWFQDPDGMGAEVARRVDAPVLRYAERGIEVPAATQPA